MDYINKQAVLEIINSYGGCDATDPCDRHCDTMMGSLYADIESLETISFSGKEGTAREMYKECKGCKVKNICSIAVEPGSVICQLYKLSSGQTKAEEERDKKREQMSLCSHFMDNIKVGNKVVCYTEGISGVVIKQYRPTACGEQTMIQTADGRMYHAPTECFMKID